MRAISPSVPSWGRIAQQQIDSNLVMSNMLTSNMGRMRPYDRPIGELVFLETTQFSNSIYFDPSTLKMCSLSFIRDHFISELFLYADDYVSNHPSCRANFLAIITNQSHPFLPT